MRMRRPTILAAGCALVALVLGLVFAGDRGPSGVDEVSWSAVGGWPDGVLRALVLPTEPYVLLPVLALLTVWCLRTSRPWDALFVVLAPAVAVAVNTWVLKPLFDRWKGDTLVYPSGHTVSLVVTFVVVLVLVQRRAVIAVFAAVLVGAAIGMIGLGYHYLTDIVGGSFFAVFAALATRGLLSAGRQRSAAVMPSA